MAPITTEPQELDEDQFIALLEARVQAAHQMSLSEFAEAIRDGRLDPESSEVARFAILIA